ncbi:MAG: Methylcrotonyl-CoA carboxylase carboxyl transferase subunit [uncultured Propionibacteriaceae bacterium]|uniref:Methylcrotonyl-CoA carboxylase carboxyl transferase subunit n=1 Tax=uncultured Propionibacteriaceae bacterium TaxID=257457 RepID=A0A6J4PIV3_9ACTN|nr:MAG: Methylcrotonyl-CoA carboxylase carboxyl transferase subunit [uncultured Propionibacteriaceae bacterium]
MSDAAGLSREEQGRPDPIQTAWDRADPIRDARNRADLIRDARNRADLIRDARNRAIAPSERAAAKLKSQHKLFVRDRIDLLFDADTFVEDGQLANAQAPGLPADGVVTGRGLVAGRPALVVANDPSVKAGSWGARTVEKIIRMTEAALRDELPIFWFIDSAGARITDQVDLFPGRRGAGRIFRNQVALSGKVPQICCLFGPSAAGGAYIPAFCDVVIMVEAKASMYLGSPRMAEMVVGERVSLEEMGGARMHASVSGCGDQLAADDADAIAQAKQYFSYVPGSWRSLPPVYGATPPAIDFTDDLVPTAESAGYDITTVMNAIVDADSFLELKPLFAAEIVTGFALLEGQPIGVVANQPAVKGGVLFVDSADKAARFIWLCDAFNLPLLYLADVPGFMIGSEVERQGIIRHGAKMITAVAEATVPTVSLIVRKAYGAGLYAMAGPGFGPDACLALPTAKIAVMGPEAAINAVYANKIADISDETERVAYVRQLRAEYEADIHILRLASELGIDAIVEPSEVRRELVARFAAAATKDRHFSSRRHGVPPV